MVTVKEWDWLRDNPMNNARMPHIPRGRVRFQMTKRYTHLSEAHSGWHGWLHGW
jgi:hypothetical protein